MTIVYASTSRTTTCQYFSLVDKKLQPISRPELLRIIPVATSSYLH